VNDPSHRHHAAGGKFMSQGVQSDTQKITQQLKGRDLLELNDYSTEEITYLIELAIELKRKQKNGEEYQPLKGKTIGLIFEKSSTRTRVSFEVGMYQLGGHALFLSSNDIQLGRGETIGDTAQVMSRYLDGIMIRTFGHDKVRILRVRFCSCHQAVPASASCQVLADQDVSMSGSRPETGLYRRQQQMAPAVAVQTGRACVYSRTGGYEPDASCGGLVRSLKGAQIVITAVAGSRLDADVIYDVGEHG
jgi:ornithine carbamoyltransferase